MNEIVKYDNILNQITFRDFDENDFNLFMVLCSRMRDLGEDKQVFEYDYLMDLMDWDRSQRLDVFHAEVKKMAHKLHLIADVDLSDDEWVSFDLFPTLRGNKKKKLLTVQINPEFKYVLNDITKNFTRFELKEYVQLNGRYSKQLYQHLKQYKSTGWWQVSVEELRHELSIPDSMETMRITTKILNPSIAVIRSCKGFSDLKVEVLRSRRRGRRVEGYKFKWTANKQIKGQMSLEDYQGDTQKAIQAKKKKAAKQKSDFDNFEQRKDSEQDFDEFVKKLTRKN